MTGTDLCVNKPHMSRSYFEPPCIYIFEWRINVRDYFESLRKEIKLSLTLVVSQQSPTRTPTNGQARNQTSTEIEQGTSATHQR